MVNWHLLMLWMITRELIYIANFDIAEHYSAATIEVVVAF